MFDCINSEDKNEEVYFSTIPLWSYPFHTILYNRVLHISLFWDILSKLYIFTRKKKRKKKTVTKCLNPPMIVMFPTEWGALRCGQCPYVHIFTVVQVPPPPSYTSLPFFIILYLGSNFGSHWVCVQAQESAPRRKSLRVCFSEDSTMSDNANLAGIPFLKNSNVNERPWCCISSYLNKQMYG